MKNQKGFATLSASLLILFLVTFTVFAGAQGSVIEQRSSINMMETDIAMSNAESGLRHMWELQKSGIDTALVLTTDAYSVVIVAEGTGYKMVSTGKTKAGAVRQVTQHIVESVTG